jgi:large-conductance mechanosensitive channel
LKKRFDFGADVFLYSVGFASVPVILLFAFYAISAGFGEPIDVPMYMWNFYVIPLISLFYSYAAWSKKIEKDSNRFALVLFGISGVSFFIIGIIKIELFAPLIFLAISMPFMIGFFAGYFVTYKTWPNLRLIAWAPTMIIISIGVMILFSMLTNMLIGYGIGPIPAVGATFFLITTAISFLIGPFLIPFLIVCLIGIVHKRFIKKKGQDENTNNSDSNIDDAVDLIKEEKENHDENTNIFDSNHDDEIENKEG